MMITLLPSPLPLLADLTQVCDRDVENLSGGELQRFAIAVVCCQKADVYMFDEPSSYLDVRQRLKVRDNMYMSASWQSAGRPGTRRWWRRWAAERWSAGRVYGRRVAGHRAGAGRQPRRGCRAQA